MPAAKTLRERNREALTREILANAREQIAAAGAASLSLRAIARDLQMSSSAIYRYFDSREAVLTALIIDSYSSLGAAVEAEYAAVADQSLEQRYRAVCHGVRRWALDHQHEYFLIYGTPVPGYAAPDDTIEPASRVANLLMGLLVEANQNADVGSAGQKGSAGRNGSAGQQEEADALPLAVRAALAPMRMAVPDVIPDEQLVTALATYSAMFGAVSFELTGQFHNSVGEAPGDRAAFYDQLITGWLRQLGWI